MQVEQQQPDVAHAFCMFEHGSNCFMYYSNIITADRHAGHN